MPAISFYANFEEFDGAVARAGENLKAFELSTKNVQGQLTRLSKAFDGSSLIREGRLVAEVFQKQGDVSKYTEAELRKMNTTLQAAAEKAARVGQVMPEAFQASARQVQAAVAEWDKYRKALADNEAAERKAKQESEQHTGSVARMVGTYAAGLATWDVAKGALLAVAGAMRQAFVSTMALADNVSNLSAKTGMSVEGLQRLSFAGASAGVDIGALADAAAELGRRLADGDKSAVGALKALGYSVQEFQALSPDDQILAVNDALQQFGSTAERNAVQADLFGKAWKTIAPAMAEDLRALGERAESLGIILDTQTIAAIDRFGDRLGQLEKVKDGLTARFFTPIFEDLDRLSEKLDSINVPLGDIAETLGRIYASGNAGNANPLVWIQAWNETQAAKAVRQTQDFYAIGEKLKAGMHSTSAAARQLGNETETLGKKAQGAHGPLREVHEVVLDQAGWDAHVARLQAASAAYRDLAVWSAAAAQGLQSAATSRATGMQWATASLDQNGRVSGLANQVSLGGFVSAQTSNGFAWQRPGVNWSGMFNQVPAQLANVFASGGSSSQVGGGLGSIAGGLGGTLAASGLGFAAGSFLGSAIPVLGTVIGGFLGRQLGGLFGPSRNAQLTQQANQGIAQTQAGLLQQYGSVGNIASMNTAGAELAAAWQSRGVAGQEHFNRLLADFNAMLGEQQRLQGELATKSQEILGYEQERARLAESLIVPYSEVERIAREYGLTMQQMGGTISQLGTTEGFTKVINDLETLQRAAQQAGGELDWGGTLKGMADEINNLVNQSIKLGTKIPENMRPFIEELMRNGQLLDENGQKITDLSNIQWGSKVESQAEKTSKAIEALDKTIADLKTAFEDIASSLRDLLPAAARDGAAGVDAAFRNTRPRITVDVDYNTNGEPTSRGYEGGEPRMAQGGIVQYPTRAIIGESGPEAVIPLSGAALRNLLPAASHMFGELRWRGRTIADIVWSEARETAVAQGWA